MNWSNVFGNKLVKTIVFIVMCVMLAACEGELFPGDNSLLAELSSVEMLYTEIKEDDVEDILVIWYGDNQTLKFPIDFVPWIYSERNRILYRKTDLFYSKVGYITSEEAEYFGRNYDDCGGGSLISNDQRFLYVADQAILSGEEEPSGSLALTAYGISSGNEILYEFSLDRNELIPPERCILGTNAEYDDVIYFSDIEGDTHVLRLFDLKTGEIGTIFSDEIIIAPSVSPQGDLIAYTKYDGIYTYNLETNEKHQIVELPWEEDGNFHFSDNFHISYLYCYVPIVSWLPSGNELGYHVATYEHDEEGVLVKTNHDIYVYSFLTERSELFLEDALNPYWVLP